MSRNTYASLASKATAPQGERNDPRQVRNAAGGFVFALDPFGRLDRFLVLGSDGGTFYVSARKLTRENAACVEACYAADAARTVAAIASVSEEGRAPRVSPAIFALAIGAAHADAQVRRTALAALPRVCRTASHLFEFVDAVRALGRGWGRTLKRAVAAWYEGRPVDALAYQVVKYRNRSGYTHKRLLQTAHPAPAADDRARRALYAHAAGAREVDAEALPRLVSAHLAAMDAKGVRELLPLVREHGLPWEALPTWALAEGEVWRALLPSMGLTALVRNLGTLTRLGVLAPLSDEAAHVAARLTDVEGLRRARVHPYALLQALAVYRSGRAVQGGTSWTPVGEVADALDRGFYAAFKAVVPSGKRHLIGLDVSGSMGTAMLSRSPLTARDASAAMALVTMAVEPRTHAVGFCERLRDLDIGPRQRLDQVVRTVSGLPFGRTDCALPMLHALDKGLSVDVFLVLTDNETWYGRTHPVEALRRYRRETGIPARLVVAGMTATDFTIADPEDAGSLDVVGFDANAPSLIADFARS